MEAPGCLLAGLLMALLTASARAQDQGRPTGILAPDRCCPSMNPPSSVLHSHCLHDNGCKSAAYMHTSHVPCPASDCMVPLNMPSNKVLTRLQPAMHSVPLHHAERHLSMTVLTRHMWSPPTKACRHHHKLSVMLAGQGTRQWT